MLRTNGRKRLDSTDWNCVWGLLVAHKPQIIFEDSYRNRLANRRNQCRFSNVRETYHI